MNLLDLIFPKRCVACGQFGSYLCARDKGRIKPAKSFCPVCLKAAVGGTTHAKCKGKLSLDGLVCIFDYSSPMKELIHELKYRFVRDLTGIFREQLRRAKYLDRYDFSSFVLVPIPLSPRRKNWRGFNQSEILGKLVAHRLGATLDTRILARTRETTPQVRLPKRERIRQTSGIFRPLSLTIVANKDFLIFDDVWTTGATMKAAAASLKRRGAQRVWALALASSH